MNNNPNIGILYHGCLVHILRALVYIMIILYSGAYSFTNRYFPGYLFQKFRPSKQPTFILSNDKGFSVYRYTIHNPRYHSNHNHLYTPFIAEAYARKFSRAKFCHCQGMEGSRVMHRVRKLNMFLQIFIGK